MTFGKVRYKAEILILLGFLSFVVALRETGVWWGSAAAYSGWVGMAQHAGQLEALRRAGNMAFWGMIGALVAGCFLFAYGIRVWFNVPVLPEVD